MDKHYVYTVEKHFNGKQEFIGSYFHDTLIAYWVFRDFDSAKRFLKVLYLAESENEEDFTYLGESGLLVGWNDGTEETQKLFKEKLKNKRKYVSIKKLLSQVKEGRDGDDPDNYLEFVEYRIECKSLNQPLKTVLMDI